MASVLAQQLQLTQQLQRLAPGGKKQRGKPSLLFDAQKAADLDGETIYEIGCQGLAELCRLNPAYGSLREALFSRAAASLVRDQQQPEVLAQLDAAIHEFCSLLTQHFLASGAFKALEYLIRKFKANEHNVASLLLAGLPYHATNEFVLLVKTLPLDASRGLWGWLAPIQSSGASLPRNVFVARCINDTLLLSWLGEAARKLGSEGSRSGGVFLSFYATAMCELISEIKVLNEGDVARLLPWVSCGLEAGASTDYRSATLMIVASLATRTTLSKDMAKALVNSMLRNHPVGEGQEGLLLRVLALVCDRQPALTRFTDKALKALVEIPSLDQELSALQRVGVRTAALLQLLGSSLARRLPAHAKEVTPQLLQLVQAGAMEQVAERLAKQLLEQACPENSTEEVPSSLLEATRQLLRALDTHYPAQTDAAVNGLLSGSKTSSKSKAAKTDKDGEEIEAGNGEQAQAQRAAAVFALVQSVFAHTARVPCADKDMTLAAAAAAPAAGVRKMALEHMNELLESGASSPAATAQMTSCILTALADEDMQVVACALTLPCMRKVPTAAVLPALAPAAFRAAGIVFAPPLDSGSVSKEASKAAAKAQKHARAALVGALQLLGALTTELQGDDGMTASTAIRDELRDVALLLALHCLLPAPHALDVFTAAIACLSSLDHPLLAHLAQLTTAAAKLQVDTADKQDADSSGKADGQTAAERREQRHAQAERRAAAAAAAERSVVTAVAQTIAEDLATLTVEVTRLLAAAVTLSPFTDGLLRARHLLVLAVNAALARAIKAGRKNPEAVAAAEVLSQLQLQIALTELATGDGSASSRAAWRELASASLDGAGLPLAEHITQLQAQGQVLHQAVLHHCLLAALETLPAGGTNPSGATPVDLTHVFCQVAILEPHGAYDAHLELLLGKVCVQPQQRAAFLAHLYCNPEGEGASRHAAEVVAVAALRLAASLASSSTHHVAHVVTPAKAKPSATSQQQSAGSTGAEMTVAVMGHVQHMVAAASSASQPVRRAAAAALQAVAAALSSVPPATHPAVSGLAQSLCTLQPHEQWIASDPSAAITLLQGAFGSKQAPTASATGTESTPVKAGKQPAKARSTEGNAQVVSYFAQLLPRLAGNAHDLHAADVLMQCLVPAQDDQGAVVTPQVAAACVELLAAIMSAAPRPLAEMQQRAAARSLQAAFTAGTQPAAATSTAAGKLFLTAIACAPISPGAPSAAEPAWFASTAPVRLAALRCMATGQLPACLQQQGDEGAQLAAAVVQSLAVCASGDANPACHDAARAALEAMPIAAAHITPVLHAAQKQQQQLQLQPTPASGAQEVATPSRKKKKGAAAEQPKAQAPSGGLVVELAPPSVLEQAVLLLELLQWKPVTGEEQVVEASQQLLAALQPAMAPLSQPHGTERVRLDDNDLTSAPAMEGGQEDDDDINNGQGASAGSAAAAAASSSLAGYAAQLILLSLAAAAQRLGAPSSTGEQMAVDEPAAGTDKKSPGRRRGASAVAQTQQAQQGQATGAMDVFDLELVVRVAQAAPDGAARNAALSLLALLAGLAPQRALTHVLQVLALVHASASASDDTHSQQVAATALAAVVPTWVASGRDITDLWRAVVSALPSLPTHRRLPLLGTLLNAAHGEEAALPAGLHALLEHVVHVQEGKVAAGQAQGGKAQEGAGSEEGEWVLELAAQLANQVPLQPRVHAFAALLHSVVHAKQGQAHSPLARLAVTFVAGQLQYKAVVGSALDHQQDEALQPACEALMTAALECVQRLVSITAGTAIAAVEQPTGTKAKRSSVSASATAPAAASGPVGPVAPVSLSKKEERAVRSSIMGVYALFAALQVVMPPHSYLMALLRLAAQPADQVRRRALRLFADRAATLPADLRRITDHPAYGAKDKAAAAERLARSALQIFPLVQQLAKDLGAAPTPASASALTHQAALTAFSHVVTACGAGHADEVLGAVPSVLAHLKHPSGAVRGSALAALAAAIRACGAQLLPQLPAAAQAAVSAGEAAAAALTASPATAGKRGSKGQAADEDEADGEGGDESAGQLAAVELSAALAALSALVSELGAFISPYLPAMLRVLLHPAVLACQSAGCAPAAAAVRGSLPVSVPSRLLLEPLFAALPYALEEGLSAVQALLSVVTAAVQRMDAAAAGAHADAVFGFLLRTLDVRSNPPLSLKGREHEAEASAVQAFVHLTLKLSEVRFKPLFLRLLEWASLPPTGAATAAVGVAHNVGPNLGRLTALFTTAAALAEKLRSVFVPYFRHLLDLAVKHLSPQQHATATKGAGKKRRQAGDATAATATVAVSETDTAAAWVLRVKILRALHRCFLYDSVGWLDSEKVSRLLPPLVAQLREAPPSGAATTAVASQCRDDELDASVSFAERSPRNDVAGVAAAAALVQMAIAANSDVHWKPLNHQVLMATRGGNARTRCLALEVVAHLVERLREEYLVLLPETLPFLSELLEDPEVAVESRAQQVLASLEEVGGEKLDQYLKT